MPHQFCLQEKEQHQGGFTLVEVLVALAIFTIVVTMAISAFLTILRSNRDIGSFVSAETNTSLTIEQMSREIRTGRGFSMPNSGTLIFTNARDVTVMYCRNNFGGNIGSILRVTGASPVCDDAQNKITANDVNIASLQFTLREGGVPTLPDRITIALSIAPATLPLVIPPVDLETTVSARNF